MRYSAAQGRSLGVTTALADAGLETVGPVHYGSWTEAWGRAATHAVLDQTPDVDAILCGSDQIARGALDALHDRGVMVPVEVAVMGFDNWEVVTAGARPSLTSVDMTFEMLGRRAAQLLVDAICGRPGHGVETMPVRIVVRGSTVAGA